MQAVRLHAVRDLRLDALPDPVPGPGQALIRIEACGVCPSELRSYLGVRKSAREEHLPRRMGHEWAGTIVAFGPDTTPSLAVGDRVVADWRVVCGRCPACRRGRFNHCQDLHPELVEGGFAQYGVAPVHQLRPIPPGVAADAAAFTEPLACVLNGHRMTPIDPGDDVVVVGAGPIGLLHLQLARARGARVIVSDPIPARREMAERLGAHEVVAAESEDPVASVRSLTEGRGADAVIVAVGGAEPMRQGIAMAAAGATVNIFAGTYPLIELPLDPNRVHYGELHLTGSHDYTPHDFTVALRLIALGIVRVAPLISHRFGLEDVQTAFETVAAHEGLKAMVYPEA